MFFLISSLLAIQWNASAADLVFQEPNSAAATQDSSKLDTDSIRISKDAITDPIYFSSRDSMVFDRQINRLMMYGNDSVASQDASLTSDFMTFRIDASVVEASGLPDSSGKMAGFPHIEEGENIVDATELKYNFKTKKAYVEGARTSEGDLYIVGTQSKFLNTEKIKRGDTIEQNVIYNSRSLLTTCNHREPHYGIRSGRQKVIANEWALMGPSYIELGGVPTPLVLPMAAAPLNKGRSTGLMFPRDYEYSPQWGYGLRNIGYYIPINEYWDLTTNFDVYLRGSFSAGVTARYKKLYKYNGNLQLSFSSYKQESVVEQEVINTRDNSISLRWSHNQDPKAHPLRSFSANVNIQTNDFARLNRNDANSVLQNSFSSRINFNQKFRDKNWNLTASFNHTQNVATGEVDIELPNLTFTTNVFQPFKNPDRVGKEKWYEKISANYTFQAKNRIETRDSLLFTEKVFENMRYGASHRARLDANLRVLKYFTVTPNVNYTEDWVFETLRREFDPRLDVTVVDTVFNEANPESFKVQRDTSYGVVRTSTVDEFRALRTFDAGINVNTQIFGTLKFQKGWLRGLRHVIKPNFSLSYTPDFSDPFWNYFDTYQTDLRADFNRNIQYSYFEESLFRSRPNGRPSMILNYSFNNIFEAKYFSAKEEKEKNFKLFQNFVINGNYDFLADSMKFSDVALSGYFSMLKNMVNFRFSGVFSPYALDEEGQVTKYFEWDENQRLLRFQSLNMDVATRFSIGQLRDNLKELFGGSAENGGGNQGKSSGVGPQSVGDLVDDIQVSHNLSMQWRGQVNRDTFFVRSHQVSLNGTIPLSEKWSIQVGRIGYDFKGMRVTYPDLGFSRDLHCWQMSLRWQPEINTYVFTIGTKPGSLDFLSLPYKRNRADGNAQF